MIINCNILSQLLVAAGFSLRLHRRESLCLRLIAQWPSAFKGPRRFLAKKLGGKSWQGDITPAEAL
jgi:hypothetical protein